MFAGALLRFVATCPVGGGPGGQKDEYMREEVRDYPLVLELSATEDEQSAIRKPRK